MNTFYFIILCVVGICLFGGLIWESNEENDEKGHANIPWLVGLGAAGLAPVVNFINILISLR